MKNYLILFLLILGFAPSIYAIESVDNSTTSPINITAKLSVTENDLLKLEKLLPDNYQEKQLQQLLTAIPVSTENMDEKMRNLIMEDVPKVRSALRISQGLQAQLTSIKVNLSVQEDLAENILSNIAQLLQRLQGIQQLLDNPINQESISTEEKEKLPNLFTRTEALQNKILAWKKVLATNQKAIQDADALLANWIKAQSKYLSEQQRSNTNTEKERLLLEKINQAKKIDLLQQKLDSEQGKLTTTQHVEMQRQLDILNTKLWFIDIDLQLLDIIENSRGSMQTLILKEGASSIVLENALNKLNNMLSRLTQLQTEVDERYAVFKKYTDIMGEQQNLTTEFQQRLKIIEFQQLQLSPLPKKLTLLIADRSKAALFSRNSWFDNELFIQVQNNWISSLVQISYQFKISTDILYKKIREHPLSTLALALGSLVMSLLTLHFMSVFEHSTFEEKTYGKGILTSWKKITDTLGFLRYPMAVALFVLILVRFFAIASPSDSIIRLVIYTFMGMSVSLVLLNKNLELEHLSRRFIYQASASVFILSLFVLLYGLSIYSGIDQTVIQFNEKGLILSLILMTAVSYRIFRLALKKEQTQNDNKYYQTFLRILIGLPWVVVSACILNLFGYSPLSWLILKHLGMLCIFLFILGVGLVVINQLRKRAKLYSIKHFFHGAFIAQDIISPLTFMLKISWVWGAGNLFFSIVGWDSNSYFIVRGLSIIQYPLLSFGQNKISFLTIVLTILSLYIVFRLALWIKNFSYRWVYSRISDLGIRSSLSIFSQYIVMLLGVLIALKVLGIDLTSLAVFAGALGVGVGLGLQDIAKNFISGILLLIERPLRNGDWVKLDGSEGYVTSIGMRSITIETFDKQEVIIPNGNAINNSFVNYTYSNSIMRTVVYVGAGYSCPPQKVIEVLSNLMKDMPDILDQPSCKIIMWEYADSCINYRIQYYIDIDKSGLLEVKNDVLSRIWYEFKENDIEIPFPQRDINFRNELVTNKVISKE